MTTTKRLTTTIINRELAARGHAEQLHRGPGYWYFDSDDAVLWPQTSVWVMRLNELTLEQWLGERDILAANKPF